MTYDGWYKTKQNRVNHLGRGSGSEESKIALSSSKAPWDGKSPAPINTFTVPRRGAWSGMNMR